MKRRHFIQNTAALGLGAGLLTTGCGSSSSGNANNSVDAIKNLTIFFEHDLVQSPQSHFNSLTQEEQDYLNFHFPNHTPSSTPYNHPNDELFVINHTGVNKLNEANTNPTQNGKRILKLSTSKQYSYESTTNKNNYAIHMFYKKIDKTSNPYNKSDEDDIVESTPPKYSLAALALVVPNGTNTDESITFSNAARETAKALIFSTPAFQHFSREDLSYALSKFDDIFIGTNLSGNNIKIATKLESAIKLIGTGQWYYYQAYREKDGTATLRAHDSKNLDTQGNPIHKVGDPIYTFPLKSSLAVHLNDDLKSVIQFFSSDDRLSSLLLPTQTSSTKTQTRVKKVYKKILAKASVHNGITYTIDNSSLLSQGAKIELKKVDNDGIHISASNHFNRHVKISAIFLDSEGYAIPLGEEQIDVGIPSLLPDVTVKLTNYVKKIGTLSPRYALMAIPLVDYIDDFTVSIPTNAHTVRFIVGAFSFNNGHNTFLYKLKNNTQRSNTIVLNDLQNILVEPVASTIAFEMAIPALLILWGANLKRDNSYYKLLASLGVNFAYGIASPFFNRPNLRGKDALLLILANMGTALLAAKNELAALLIKDISESEVEDSMPIAGQIFRAINVAVDVANLGQTFYAVSTVNAINTVDITRSHTLHIQLQSDPKDNDFPLNVDSIVVTLSHSNVEIADSPYTLTWDRNNVVSHTTNGGPTHSTYDISIDNVPAGGVINIAVQLKIGNWVAAHKEQLRADNLTENNILLIMKENLIPIGSNSIYQHYAKLTKSNGSYVWNVKPENGTFLPSASVSDANRVSNELLKISVNDPIGAIGYSYKDLNSNLYVVKNISAVLETPNQGTKSATKDKMMQLSYNLLASSSTDKHIVFERKNGVTYVRSIDINSQSTDFKINFTQNIGMFISAKISQFAYYPAQSVLAGLDTELGVLHILRHLDSPRDDSDTNRYLNAQSMVKTRSIVSARDVDPKTQYMYNPQLLTMSPSGDIIILENTRSGDTRLRAFDKHGTVYLNFPGFNNATGVFQFQQEENSVRYLDINIESKGFIYVLKQLGANPSDEETYFLDIYDPSSSHPNQPIVTTKGFSTGKIKVDYWRRVYALNYETTEDNEPTISIWLPPVPQ